MRRKPEHEDEFDAWLAELCREFRSYKRVRRRALMKGKGVKPETSVAQLEIMAGDHQRPENVWCWPRADDPELKLNEAASAARPKRRR